MRQCSGVLLHANIEELERLAQLRLRCKVRIDLAGGRLRPAARFLGPLYRHELSPIQPALPRHSSEKRLGFLRRITLPCPATASRATAPPLPQQESFGLQ